MEHLEKSARLSIVPVHNALSCIPSAKESEFRLFPISLTKLPGDFNEQTALGSRYSEPWFAIDGIEQETQPLIERYTGVALMGQFTRQHEDYLIQVLRRSCQCQVRFRGRIERAGKNSQPVNRRIWPSQKCEPHILL